MVCSYNAREPVGQTVFRAAFLGTFLAVAKSTSPAGATTGNAWTEYSLTPYQKPKYKL